MPINTLASFFLSLVLSIIGFKIYLKYFKSFLPKYVRDYGPKSHLAKQGTPTMGGAVIWLSTLITLLILAPNREIIASLLLITGYAFIGGIDDYLGIKKKSSQPSKARYKFAIECIITLIWLLTVKHFSIFDLKADFLLFHITSTFWIYVFETLFIVGMANAVNETDGVDGLAGTITSILLVFIFMMFKDTNLSLLTLALLGGLSVFLFYNAHPAKLIMGDVGSLSLGSSIAVMGIIVGKEWIVLILGVVFLIEAFSVMLQVPYYKLTKKRIFKMTPIHHHFELSGWSEPQIVTRFSLLTLIAAILGVFINGPKW